MLLFLLMDKFDSKRILPIVVLILFLIPVVTSSLLDLEIKKEGELIRQKILAEQKAIENAEKKIYLMGKFDPALKKDFVLIPNEHNVSGYQTYLRKETLEAFLQMAETAKMDGVELKIASATRNFENQKIIWEKKWTGYILVGGKDLTKSQPDELERFKKILEYSAVPGTSRHHWGTDIDINNSNPQYFKTEIGQKEYAWLVVNAPLFGFCQPYTLKGQSRPTGYYEEKWHWSYLPLAKTFTEEYKKLVKEGDINGFMGDQYVPELNLINDYVFGINPECL